MRVLVLSGKEILELGFSKGKTIGIIIKIMADLYTMEQKEYIMNLLRAILKNPEKFRNHETFGEIVSSMSVDYGKSQGIRMGYPAPKDEGVICGAPVLKK